MRPVMKRDGTQSALADGVWAGPVVYQTLPPALAWRQAASSHPIAMGRLIELAC